MAGSLLRRFGNRVEQAARALRGAAPPEPQPPSRPGQSWGSVVLPVGQHFAGAIEMLMFDRFKAVAPLSGISPFTLAEPPDPAMAQWATSQRTNDRVKADVLKDFGSRIAAARADYLVIDNSAAALPLRLVDDRLYTVLGGERTDFMDQLWNRDRKTARASLVRPERQGLSRQWRERYARFVALCRKHFDAEHLVLVRSHVARFWVDPDGVVALTKSDRRVARLLESLDAEFARATSCRVVDAPLGFFPTGQAWTGFDDGLRLAIEGEVVAVCGGAPRVAPPQPGKRHRVRTDVQVSGRQLARLSGYWGPRFSHTAADHVADTAAAGGKLDPELLRAYFGALEATHDDLLALAWLEQHTDEAALVSECVRLAVSDSGSLPARQTRDRFDSGLAALRAHPGCALRDRLDVVAGATIAVRVGPDRFLRFTADGAITAVGVWVTREFDLDAGGADLRLDQVPAALRSWPLYLERGRRRVTVAMTVSVPSPAELVDSCHWLDWAKVLAGENLVITLGPNVPGDPGDLDSLVDLSFWFDPATRVASVSGGMMDQLTEIGAFLRACGEVGVDCVLDDLVYVYKRTHDGFVASQLAPWLDDLRISRRVSRSLLESFREQARTAKFPWPWENPRIWHRLGIRELTVVSPDTPAAVVRAPQLPEIPIVFYPDQDRAAERRHLAEPPAGVPLYVYPIRLPPLDPASSAPLRSVFDLKALPAERLNDRNSEAARRLRASPTVALHVRRGDYVIGNHPGWHGDTAQYRAAIEFVAGADEFAHLRPLNLAVFSDDADFVRAHPGELGLDLADGEVVVVDWNRHFESVWDAYLMSLCPVVIGSVGGFAATAGLLAAEPNTYLRALTEGPVVIWDPTTR